MGKTEINGRQGFSTETIVRTLVTKHQVLHQGPERAEQAKGATWRSGCLIQHLSPLPVCCDAPGKTATLSEPLDSLPAEGKVLFSFSGCRGRSEERIVGAGLSVFRMQLRLGGKALRSSYSFSLLTPYLKNVHA